MKAQRRKGQMSGELQDVYYQESFSECLGQVAGVEVGGVFV